MVHFYLSILIICAFITNTYSQEIKYKIQKTKHPPTIDGVLDDICWSETLSYPLDELKLKACYDNSFIYLAVTFPAIIKSTTHRPWKWDVNQNLYLPGAEQESTLTFILSTTSSKLQDLWFWRSARTNPTGYADDFHITTHTQNSTKALFKQDTGLPCWYSQYFGRFAGYEIPRFYNQTPTESAKDIEAKGTWQNELWTVELKRKLNTHNPDDLDISSLADINLQLFIGLPLREYLNKQKCLINLEFSKEKTPLIKK